MSDYISRAAAVSILHYNCDEKCGAVVSDMENIPSEDVAPVVHGKWIVEKNLEDGNVQCRCSKCYHGDIQSPSTYVPYCWYCGAKMDAE